MSSFRFLILFAACAMGQASLAGSSAPVSAGGTAPPAAPPTGILLGRVAGDSWAEQAWSLPVLYQNSQNPWLQELALQGQLQTQYASGSANLGNYGSDDLPDNNTWGDAEVRRFRLGVRARLFNQLKLHYLNDLEPDLQPRVYRNMTEGYLTWMPSEAFNLSVGKVELKFSREQEISSREYLTFERSQLVNQFYGGEVTGAWVAGKGIAGGWFYELGAYSNDRVDEYSEFTGGTLVLAKLGLNFTKQTPLDLAQVQLHYLHNSEPGYRATDTNPAAPRFSHSFALSNDLTRGPFGLATECFWGNGALNQEDVVGISFMPTYLITPKLQAIATLQLAASQGDDGITLPLRYEGLVDVPNSDKAGDRYVAGYAGLIYYFHGHKLKAMSGVKYSELSGGPSDFNGWTWLVGVRSAF